MTVKDFLFSSRTFPGQRKHPVEVWVKRHGKNIRLFRGEDIDDIRYLSTTLFDAKIEHWSFAEQTIMIFVYCNYEMACGEIGYLFDRFCKLNADISVDKNGQMQKCFKKCCIENCPIVHLQHNSEKIKV